MEYIDLKTASGTIMPSTSTSQVPAKERAEIIGSAMSLILKFSGGFGALATFLYLMVIQYFPSGLTPGEVVFFSFIALAFSVVYGVMVLYGALSIIWLLHAMVFVRRLRWLRYHREQLELFPPRDCLPFRWFRRLPWHVRVVPFNKDTDKIYLFPLVASGKFHLFLSLLFFVLFSGIAIERGSTELCEFVISAMAAGFVFLIFVQPVRRAPGNIMIGWVRAIATAILPLVLIFLYAGIEPFLNIVFSRLGVRQAHVAIDLPEEEVRTLRLAEDVLKRPLLDCREREPKRVLIHGAEILWTGIGDLTVVRLSNPPVERRVIFAPKPPAPNVVLRFESKEIKLVSAYPRISPCYFLPWEELLDRERKQISPAGALKLAELARYAVSISSLGEVLVKGHDEAPAKAPPEMPPGGSVSPDGRIGTVVAVLRRGIKAKTVQFRSEKMKRPSLDYSAGNEADRTIEPDSGRRQGVEIHFVYGG